MATSPRRKGGKPKRARTKKANPMHRITCRNCAVGLALASAAHLGNAGFGLQPPSSPLTVLAGSLLSLAVLWAERHGAIPPLS